MPFLKVLKIQKAISKELPEVIKKWNVRIQCPFKGAKWQLEQRWQSFNSQRFKLARDHCFFWGGCHCLECFLLREAFWSIYWSSLPQLLAPLLTELFSICHYFPGMGNTLLPIWSFKILASHFPTLKYPDMHSGIVPWLPCTLPVHLEIMEKDLYLSQYNWFGGQSFNLNKGLVSSPFRLPLLHTNVSFVTNILHPLQIQGNFFSCLL